MALAGAEMLARGSDVLNGAAHNSVASAEVFLEAGETVELWFHTEQAGQMPATGITYRSGFLIAPA